MPQAPSYLLSYEKTFEKDPRQAAREWFRDARFGLFLHYGVYSLLGRGEWVMQREKIPVAEYARLKDRFTAERFNADAIADLACSAEMRYITITTRHHDSFCLFRTKQTGFNSLNSPARRDLIGELAEACRRKGLGLFLYYSYACDWSHPYFYPREAGCDFARPAYDKPQPEYLYKKEEDFKHYIAFAHAQLRELLTQYGPAAGIWFDPIMGYYFRPNLFPIHETYDLIRSLQPQVLISFKQVATGTEDFASPEHTAGSLVERLKQRKADERIVAVARRAWESNKGKHNEICTTMHPWWGYVECPDAQHKSADDVIAMLANAAAHDCNLCLNTGPLPDGSIHTKDAATLHEVGERIRRHGFPKGGASPTPAGRRGPSGPQAQ